MNKRILAGMLVLILATLACGSAMPTQQVNNVATIVAATMQALTTTAPTAPAPASTAMPTTASNIANVSYKNVSFTLSHDLATNALAGTVPAVAPTTDGPGWDVAPEYIKFKLDNYAQFNTSHDAQIMIYPAADYAAVDDFAAKNIDQLKAILKGTSAPTAENLPSVPSFNAGQVFAAQIQPLQFQSGSGIRFLTEYAQYVATANNADLYYEFQGLTADGKYYIIAVLPTSHPTLAYNADPNSTVPSGGITFPGMDNSNAIPTYYANVVNLLNSVAPNSFTPALGSLDTLIQSITIISQ